MLIMKFLSISMFVAYACAGHWEELMVYRKDCGTVEKRCVADSPIEVHPTCESIEQICNAQDTTLVYLSWEEAIAKLGGTVHLKIGSETKKVPIMISVDGKMYLIFQRRLNGEMSFYRKWNDYVDGFGNPEREYWIGLRALNILTSTGKFDMTVFLESFNNTQVYARYDTFQVDGPESFYKLSVGAYSGTAGDGMAYQNNMMFSTQDQDHDTWNDNCADKFRGAWWYSDCHRSNLNGNYYDGPGNHSNFADGVNWYPFMGHQVSMKKAIMALSLR